MVFGLLNRTACRMLGVALVALCLAATTRAPAFAVEPSGEIFGFATTRLQGLASFPRWTSVIERYVKGGDPFVRHCKGDVFRACMSDEWKRFLDEVKTEDRFTQIRLVNQRMNRARYTIDAANYGQPEYWATPNQFFHLNGDCEDYAISKYYSLRALGFDDSALRIVVLDDQNLRIPHAVLAVWHEDRYYILDNQISQVIPASSIRHYRPIYALNEQSWWLFRPKTPGS